MKSRMVKTAFYSDEKVEQLSKDGKWLFMYIITCPYIGLTGAFQVTDKRIMYDTGLTPKELEVAKQEITDLKMASFINSWVVIFNTDKHNKYSQSKTTKAAYDSEFSELPEGIHRVLENKDTILMGYKGYKKTFIPIETINRNKKPEIYRGIAKGGSLKDISEDDLQQIASAYKVPLSFVKSKYEDLQNYCGAKGKTYRNYLLALKDWVKRDSLKIIKEANYANTKRAIDATGI